MLCTPICEPDHKHNSGILLWEPWVIPSADGQPLYDPFSKGLASLLLQVFRGVK